MRKIALLLVAMLGLLLVACGAGQPQITLEKAGVDLGDVVNGVVVTREVAVQNTGNKALIIEAVSTSCGCTKATLEPMTIAPGESATLHIEFDSGAHGEELKGPLTRQIFIASNDPARSEAIVELTANVLPPGSS
jgi:hypothetical protein